MSVFLRKKEISNGRFSLYLDINVNGSRHCEFLRIYLKKNSPDNKQNLQLAQSIASTRQLEIQNNEYGFVPHFKRKANFIEYFDNLIKSRNNCSSVWLATKIHIQEFAGNTVPFSAINEQWLEQFQAYLLSKVKQNSAREYFSKLKQVLKTAVKEKIIQHNPSLNIKSIKSVETQRNYLSIEEVRLLANTNCRNANIKDAFLFACYTGLRFSDVQALTWENINGKKIEFRQMKTKGFEYMPLSDMAQSILQQISIRNGATVLPMKTNKIFNLGQKNTVRLALIKWAKDAGIEKHISFHTSRHTFATLLLTSDVNQFTIMKLLGHKNIATTQIYAKVIDQKKQDAVNRLPSISFV